MCEFVLNGRLELWAVANRRIGKGERLFTPYGTDYWMTKASNSMLSAQGRLAVIAYSLQSGKFPSYASFRGVLVCPLPASLYGKTADDGADDHLMMCKHALSEAEASEWRYAAKKTEMVKLNALANEWLRLIESSRVGEGLDGWYDALIQNICDLVTD